MKTTPKGFVTSRICSISLSFLAGSAFSQHIKVHTYMHAIVYDNDFRHASTLLHFAFECSVYLMRIFFFCRFALHHIAFNVCKSVSLFYVLDCVLFILASIMFCTRLNYKMSIRIASRELASLRFSPDQFWNFSFAQWNLTTCQPNRNFLFKNVIIWGILSNFR